MNNNIYLKTMVDHYLMCALWACSLDEGTSFEELFDINDFDRDSINRAKKDCEKFISLAGSLLRNWSPEQAGHDFYLSRNGHGAGFFDRTELADKIICQKLQSISNQFGSRYCFTINNRSSVGIE